MSLVALKVILPPAGHLAPARYVRAVENALTGTAKAVKVDFDTTTRTWKNRPVFAISTPAPLSRAVGTDDDIYRFVARGTSVRYALMSPDFRAKTTPGVIGSNKGKGGVIGVFKQHPRPGIQARNFEKIIKLKWDREMPTQIQRAIDAEVSRRV